MSEIHQQRIIEYDALSRVDNYFASVLDCRVNDLRVGGWTPLVSHVENDTMALLFGMRQVVYLLAPMRVGSNRAGPAGVASLAAELRDEVAKLLNLATPQVFFRPDSLTQLDQVVRANINQPLAPGSEPRLNVFYTTKKSFQPYIGPWVEWIERLDESTETDPFALALLARHAGGVFVVRHHGSIIAYAGLRAYSRNVWELTRPRVTASMHAHVITRTDELFAALITHATRAAVEHDRIPIHTISARDSRFRRMLLARGYLHYANASVYATTTP